MPPALAAHPHTEISVPAKINFIHRSSINFVQPNIFLRIKINIPVMQNSLKISKHCLFVLSMSRPRLIRASSIADQGSRDVKEEKKTKNTRVPGRGRVVVARGATGRTPGCRWCAAGRVRVAAVPRNPDETTAARSSAWPSGPSSPASRPVTSLRQAAGTPRARHCLSNLLFPI